jgi:hypothetical protein
MARLVGSASASSVESMRRSADRGIIFNRPVEYYFRRKRKSSLVFSGRRRWGRAAQSSSRSHGGNPASRGLSGKESDISREFCKSRSFPWLTPVQETVRGYRYAGISGRLGRGGHLPEPRLSVPLSLFLWGKDKWAHIRWTCRAFSGQRMPTAGSPDGDDGASPEAELRSRRRLGE